ncbi:ABC transporter ATP-binding protein [Mycoplasmopsis hyopharyngis]|uniref:ABC transporter ATP-binding protein n=1 Tax=Mycoplasmopsis hyopharyngis TaxID=29558 RepID=UPI00387319CF
MKKKDINVSNEQQQTKKAKSKWTFFKKIAQKFKTYKTMKKDIATRKSNANTNNIKPADDVAISIQNLSMIFKNTLGQYKIAVDDVSFEVKKGQFHGFIGDNGAGKTTTIRSILGFYPNHIGNIYLNGFNAESKKAKNTIGYIPEVAIFPRKLTVREYLIHFALMSNIKKNVAIKRVDELLKHYHFDSKEMNKSAVYMSSGQKKTVLLMQALLNDPDILIMDEPAANLDPTARLNFFEAIKELNEQGKTIFISSHILLELERYIDSYTVLQDGKLIDTGLTKDKIKIGKFNYIINTDNNELFIDIVKKLDINYEIKDGYIYCVLDYETQQKLFQNCFTENIKFILFKENRMSLNEMYFNVPKAN